MRTTLFLIPLLFILINSISAQKIDTIYYNKNWIETNSNDFYYFRLFVKIGDIVKVTDYYKNGKTQMTGGYKSNDFKEQTGPFFYYNKKGHITNLEVYEPNKYSEIQIDLNNSGVLLPTESDSLVLFGEYYKNGKIKYLGYGRDLCSRQGTWLYYFKNGTISYKMNYLNNQLHGEYIIYLNNGSTYLRGNYSHDKKDGAWEYYSFSGKLKMTEYFSNGEKIKKIH
jgi:uncharacterized protein